MTMNRDDSASTIELEDRIGKCEEIDELKEIVTQYSSHYFGWSRYINHLLSDMGFSYRSFAERCGFSKNTVKAWCREGMLPRSRETFIKLGLGLRMEIDDINHLLQKYGRYQSLYPKAIEDAICIFVVQNYDKLDVQKGSSPYEYYKQLTMVFCDEMMSRNDRTLTGAVHGKDTRDVLISLSSVENLEDFRSFIDAHEQEFKESNYKLLAFIDTYMMIEHPELARGKLRGYHTLVCEKELSAGFNRMISRLRHWGELPNRTQLIALGIHLNLSVKEINLMLGYANMGSLCAKDKLECVLIYALTQMELLHPENEYEHMNNLQKLAADQSFISEYLKIYEDISDFRIDGELEEDIAKYICRMIISMDTEEAKELLRLLQ